jgi:chromosome segregation ATPase
VHNCDSHVQIQTQVKERLGVLQREINFREDEIAKLNVEIEQKSAEASAASVSSQVTEMKKTELEGVLVHKDMQIKKLQTELDDVKR